MTFVGNATSLTSTEKFETNRSQSFSAISTSRIILRDMAETAAAAGGYLSFRRTGDFVAIHFRTNEIYFHPVVYRRPAKLALLRIDSYCGPITRP